MNYKSDNLVKNLNDFIKNQEGITKQGLSKAYDHIQERTIQITPKDSGTLRRSFYKRFLITPKKSVAIEIGNNANYALAVHENLNVKFNLGEAKFLEKGISRNIEAIKKIITSRLKV
jgi:hypothetical protein